MGRPLGEKRAAVLAIYAETQNLSEAARRVGMSRERARQIVTGAGDRGIPNSGRYTEARRIALADIAYREGVLATARIAKVGAANLRTWVYWLYGAEGKNPGRPREEEAEARDGRIRTALMGLPE